MASDYQVPAGVNDLAFKAFLGAGGGNNYEQGLVAFQRSLAVQIIDEICATAYPGLLELQRHTPPEKPPRVYHIGEVVCTWGGVGMVVDKIAEGYRLLFGGGGGTVWVERERVTGLATIEARREFFKALEGAR